REQPDKLQPFYENTKIQLPALRASNRNALYHAGARSQLPSVRATVQRAKSLPVYVDLHSRFCARSGILDLLCRLATNGIEQHDKSPRARLEMTLALSEH